MYEQREQKRLRDEMIARQRLALQLADREVAKMEMEARELVYEIVYEVLNEQVGAQQLDVEEYRAESDGKRVA